MEEAKVSNCRYKVAQGDITVKDLGGFRSKKATKNLFFESFQNRVVKSIGECTEQEIPQ